MTEQAAEEQRDILRVVGVPPLDGDYEFNLIDMMSIGMPESLTNREGHDLKRMTGVRIGELEDALTAGDNDVLVGFGIIILRRAGKRFDEDRLWDAPIGAALQYDFAHERAAATNGAQGEESDEEIPPASGSPESEQPTSNDDVS